MADWQSMTGKHTPIGQKFHRTLLIEMWDNYSGLRIRHEESRPLVEFEKAAADIRQEAHRKLDLLLDKIFAPPVRYKPEEPSKE